MTTKAMSNISSILLRIDERKAHLDGLRATMDNYRIREALRIEFLYESNRIEGNTLTLRETQLVLQEGMTISGRSLREHLEAINHKEAIAFVEELVASGQQESHQELKQVFSEYVLKQIHALVLHGIDHDNAGRYRSVPVLISGSRHIPPQPHLLQSLMEEYFAWYNAHKNHLHPVEIAATLHERLVTIHPFIDGNGRTARLVMNVHLLRHGFPLAIIGGDAKQRIAYYDALEHAQITGESQGFTLFIAECVLDSLERYIRILGDESR